jgi:glycosyltransferase involved in cell wall biosynthesis
MTESIRYSAIVPVYGNRDSIPELIERLAMLSRARHGRVEAVFVVDGSPDDSLECLRTALAEPLLPAQLVSLSRNFGSFSAIRAGLSLARGQYVGVMAADLQEPPEILDAFFDSMEAGECDIALGQRIGRADPAVSSLASRVYWGMYRRFVNREIPRGGVDVFGCTAEIAARISSFPETHTSLIGLLYWIGYRRKYFPYARQARRHGKSGWTFGRKLRYLLDSIYAFTDLPILALQAIGLIGVVGSTLVGLFVFMAWLLGSIREPGYTPLMIVLLASTSAILFALGVVGSYIARAYENSKGRPVSLVASHEFFGPRG